MALNCSYHRDNICRSCTLIESDYNQQILIKEESLRLTLGATLELLPSVKSQETGFRNKAKIIVSGTLEKPILGILDKELLNCPVHHPRINEILKSLVSFIQTAKLAPYDIKTKKGELKGVILFVGDESYVRFVLRSKESIDRIKKNLPELLKTFPELKCASVNIQPIHQAILEGEEEIFLTEKQDIQQKFNGLKLRIRPQGFVQTNHQMAEMLYSTAASWVKEIGARKFVELYSGQGPFSFHCAQFVEEATGIEINPEAVKMAKELAEELKLNHLEFISMDAQSSEIVIESKNADVILVNPPRRGLSESAELLLNIGPQWIIYSSCSHESLAQDIKRLSKKYSLVKTQIFDMFPHTNHFETLVLLKKN